MDKFWEWMRKKGYARLEDGEYCLDYHEDWYIEFSKQMLIGYMIEYINLKTDMNNAVGMSYPEIYTVFDLYNDLKLRIEGIK